jgi:hypothetical protein
MIERNQQGRRLLAVLAVGTGLLAGCTGPDADDGETSPPPTNQLPTSPPASSWSTPTALEPVEFRYAAPEQPCPRASALRLPSAEAYPYESIDPLLDEQPGSILSICEYNLAGLTDDERQMVLNDHVWIFAQVSLRPSRTDLFLRELDDLPLESDDLGDWDRAASVYSDDRGVVWQGCGNGIPCADGEEPTVQTRAMHTDVRGRVGNIQFIVGVTYTAVNLPADVELRNLAIFRDLVLADVARREQME